MKFLLIFLVFLAFVFWAGAVFGYFLGRRVGKKASREEWELAVTQKNYAESSLKMRDAVESYEGNTFEEKYANFLKSLDQTSFAHLGPDMEEKFKFVRQYLKDNSPQA